MAPAIIPKQRGSAHVEARVSHREQRWETPSASLIEWDPEEIPDVDIAARVGRDLSLDEKLPRHESGHGYVRLVEHLVMRKERKPQRFHIPRTDDVHRRRHKLDDNEQHI